MGILEGLYIDGIKAKSITKQKEDNVKEVTITNDYAQNIPSYIREKMSSQSLQSHYIFQSVRSSQVSNQSTQPRTITPTTTTKPGELIPYKQNKVTSALKRFWQSTPFHELGTRIERSVAETNNPAVGFYGGLINTAVNVPYAVVEFGTTVYNVAKNIRGIDDKVKGLKDWDIKLVKDESSKLGFAIMAKKETGESVRTVTVSGGQLGYLAGSFIGGFGVSKNIQALAGKKSVFLEKEARVYRNLETGQTTRLGAIKAGVKSVKQGEISVKGVGVGAVDDSVFVGKFKGAGLADDVVKLKTANVAVGAGKSTGVFKVASVGDDIIKEAGKGVRATGSVGEGVVSAGKNLEWFAFRSAEGTTKIAKNVEGTKGFFDVISPTRFDRFATVSISARRGAVAVGKGLTRQPTKAINPAKIVPGTLRYSGKGLEVPVTVTPVDVSISPGSSSQKPNNKPSPSPSSSNVSITSTWTGRTGNKGSSGSRGNKGSGTGFRARNEVKPDFELISKQGQGQIQGELEEQKQEQGIKIRWGGKGITEKPKQKTAQKQKQEQDIKIRWRWKGGITEKPKQKTAPMVNLKFNYAQEETGIKVSPAMLRFNFNITPEKPISFPVKPPLSKVPRVKPRAKPKLRKPGGGKSIRFDILPELDYLAITVLDARGIEKVKVRKRKFKEWFEVKGVLGEPETLAGIRNPFLGGRKKWRLL